MTTPSPPPSPSTRAARADLLLALGLALLVGLLACSTLISTDIWWHVKTGRLLWEEGSIPRADPFRTGFVDAGRPYIDLHWLFQLAAFAAHAAAGVPGLVGLKVLLAVAAVWMASALARPPAAPAVALLVWVPAAFLLWERLIVRPELFTLALVALFLVRLERADDRPGALWPLVPAQIVWVNAQGLFFLGPVLVLLWWAGRATSALIPGARRRPVARSEVAASGAIALACLANPYGLRGALFPLQLLGTVAGGDPSSDLQIGELQPPWSATSPGWALHLALALVLLCALSFAANRRRFRPFRLLVAMLFTVFWMLAVRNVGLLAIAVGAVTAANLGEASGARPRRWMPAARATLALALLAGGWAVATSRWHAWTGGERRFGLGATPGWYAGEAVAFIGAAGLPQRVLLIHIGHAGEFLHRLSPPYRAFMDGRLELNSPETFAAYRRIVEGMRDDAPAWSASLGTYGVDVVLVDHAFPANVATLIARADWSWVHTDGVASVFLRSTHGDLVERFQVDLAATHYGAAPVPDPPVDAPASLGLLSPLPAPPPALRQARDLMQIDAHLLGPARFDAARHRALTMMIVRRASEALAAAPGAWEAHQILGRASLFATWPPALAAAAEPWDASRALPSARAAFHFRRALEGRSSDFESRFRLWQLLQSAGAHDLAAGEARHLLRSEAPTDAARAQALAQVRVDLTAFEAAPPPAVGSSEALLAAGRAGAVLAAAEAAGSGSLAWETVERASTIALLIGRPDVAVALCVDRLAPAEARSPAARLRVAAAHLAQDRRRAAEEIYESLLAGDDPPLEAARGLAALRQERGDAAGALAACIAGQGLMALRPPGPQNSWPGLETQIADLKPYAHAGSSTP